MLIQGLDGRPQKILKFLTSKFGSSKKCFAIANENRLNGGYALFVARLTFKMGQNIRERQRMHSQGLDGRLQIFLELLMSES